MRFNFDEAKGRESLTYVAERWPGVTAFFASKALFFAEKWHLNRYGRPIVADTFVAMPNGPVPSTLYDFLKGRIDLAGDPQALSSALRFQRQDYVQVHARRPADRDLLSESDIECLDEAVAFCRGKSFKELSNLTHQERSWANAPPNGVMEYSELIDEGHEDALHDAEEFAVYGVL